MAYSASGLCRMGGDSNGNMWTYTTTDTIATVNSAGYLVNKVSGVLTNNDIINNNTSGTIMNLGTITLSNGSILTNHATLKNWIQGINKGVVTVQGTMTNQNSIFNKGSINISSGTLNNYLNLVNDNYIIEQGSMKLFKTSN